MALAARCPNCKALFRVVADQLKLRGGLVRCGVCRQVFDAIGSLTYVDDGSFASRNAPSSGAAPPKRGPAPPTLYISADEIRLPAAVATQPAPPDEGVPTLSRGTEPGLRETRPGRAEPDAAVEPRMRRPARAAATRERAPDTAPEPATAPRPPADEAAGADAAREAARDAETEAETETEAEAEPDLEPLTRSVDPLPEEQAPLFLRRAQLRPRRVSLAFAAGSALLALALAFHVGLAFRTGLLTTWPELRPALLQICSLYGCSVEWPMHAELLAVVGSELQAIPGTDAMELSAVIRNRAGYTMSLPALEVTLTDTQNRAIARKVFAPADYLGSRGEPSARIDEGLGAGADYPVRLVFEARGLSAAGFVVYPFYE